MPEQIYTFTDKELAEMFKSGQMKLLTSPEPPKAEEASENLHKEWKKQAKRLADLFAKELGQSKEEYMNSLPKFFPQPQSYKGRFSIPLIVQIPTEKLALKRMLEIIGVVSYLDLEHVRHWEEDPFKFQTGASYTTWLYHGHRTKLISVDDIRNNLGEDERGGTLLDGLALLLQDSYSEFFTKSLSCDLPGSQYCTGGVPCLVLSDESVILEDEVFVGRNFKHGLIIAGREIRT